jgi:hypothetical protein
MPSHFLKYFLEPGADHWPVITGRQFRSRTLVPSSYVAILQKHKNSFRERFWVVSQDDIPAMMHIQSLGSY